MHTWVTQGHTTHIYKAIPLLIFVAARKQIAGGQRFRGGAPLGHKTRVIVLSRYLFPWMCMAQFAWPQRRLIQGQRSCHVTYTSATMRRRETYVADTSGHRWFRQILSTGDKIFQEQLQKLLINAKYLPKSAKAYQLIRIHSVYGWSFL